MTFDHQNTPLSAEQARVLATLMEKQRTVPDSYPLTLNSLLSGCNQKTSREPLMQLSEAEALGRPGCAARTPSGGRSQRPTRHALGAQLRARAGRAQPSRRSAGLADLARPANRRRAAHQCRALAPLCRHLLGRSVLEELQERSADKGGPLVRLLPKAPGAREARWAQLLCGEPVVPSAPAAHHGAAAAGWPDMNERVAVLEAQVAQLQQRLDALTNALGT